MGKMQNSLAKLQSVWQKFLVGLLTKNSGPKIICSLPLTRGCTIKKLRRKSPYIDFLLVSFVGLDPSTLDGADLQTMICGFGPWWFGKCLRCKPIAFDTIVQMGKPGPLLVQTLGLGNVNTSTYLFYWANHWTGPGQPSW